MDVAAELGRCVFSHVAAFADAAGYYSSKEKHFVLSVGEALHF